jgi:transposase InsO family protein
VDVSAWRLRASGELAWVAFVVDNFSRAILSYSVEVSRSGVAIIGVLDAAEVFARQSTRSGQIRDVIILCDHGSENRSKLVQSYISERPGWRMVFAQRDIRSSNACVEGVFRLLKQRSLRRRNPSTLRAVRQAVGRFVNEYNLEIPHNALKGALPIEVYKGDSPDSHWRRAKALRREAQRSRGEIDSGGVITRTAS